MRGAKPFLKHNSSKYQMELINEFSKKKKNNNNNNNNNKRKKERKC